MFPSTSWSLVVRAAGPDARRSALEELCATYWRPVYEFIRNQGSGPEEAKDLTQAFFTRLLEKHDLLPPEPEHCRFRYFLLAAVKHFLSNERDRARTRKRGGGRPAVIVNFDSGREQLPREAVEARTPDKIFEQQWAILMLDRAVHALRQEFEYAGKTREFEALKECLQGDGPDGPYREVGASLGMSEAAIKSAVHRMRLRFGETLRAEIAQTVSEPAEVEDELRYLLSVMSA